MQPIDPDLLGVLNTIGTQVEARRVVNARKKYVERAQRELETEMELLEDEVERVVDRSNPLFESVLILTAIKKIAKRYEEHENPSGLEFPNGF